MIVFVIDPNQAVQAIATLALKQDGHEVIAFPDLTKALAASLRPDIVVCSRDLPGIDVLNLCRRMKAEQLTRYFVLLAPKDSADAMKQSAVEAGVDEVLLKPFKSEQLRECIGKIISAESRQRVLVVTDDPLLKALVSELVANLGFQAAVQTPPDIKSVGGGFKFTVAAEDCCLSEEWYSADLHGHLLVLGAALPPKHKNATLVKRPINENELSAALQKILGTELMMPPEHSKHLTFPEQAKLAAKISAAIFEQLLREKSLRDGKWDEAGELVKQELLRVCLTFENLSETTNRG